MQVSSLRTRKERRAPVEMKVINGFGLARFRMVAVVRFRGGEPTLRAESARRMGHGGSWLGRNVSSSPELLEVRSGLASAALRGADLTGLDGEMGAVECIPQHHLNDGLRANVQSTRFTVELLQHGSAEIYVDALDGRADHGEFVAEVPGNILPTVGHLGNGFGADLLRRCFLHRHFSPPLSLSIRYLFRAGRLGGACGGRGRGGGRRRWSSPLRCGG